MDTNGLNHERHGKVRVGVARRPARTSNGRWEGRVVGGIVFPPTTRPNIRTFRRFSSKRRISHQSHSGMAVGEILVSDASFGLLRGWRVVMPFECGSWHPRS